MSDKRQLLREALRDILDQCLNDPSVEYSEFPEKLVGMVVAAGWQWHPPKLVEEWRDIPGYIYWEMSNGYLVRNKLTKTHVEVTFQDGTPTLIALWDDHGFDKVETLHELIKLTWPNAKDEQ